MDKFFSGRRASAFWGFAAFCMVCAFAFANSAHAQQETYDQDMRAALLKLLGQHSEKDAGVVYARRILQRFDKGQAPTERIKRTVGLAINFETGCTSLTAVRPCPAPEISPAMIVQEGDRIAVLAVRSKAATTPELKKESYVQQFIAGSLAGVGKTREFQYMLRQKVPADFLGKVVNQSTQELAVEDELSLSFIRHQGPWLFAVSKGLVSRDSRTMVYAFPNSVSLAEEDKIFSLLK